MGGRGHVQHPYLEFRRGGHRRGMGRTTGSSVSVVRIAERAVRAFRVPDNAAVTDSMCGLYWPKGGGDVGSPD
ncbi:hypothetical protein GPALN_002230 [Globodera pallida]|nr:hypothetical protein GPALN_002230 [Globodera pallida]